MAIRDYSNLYVNGLEVARASNTTLTVATGKCRDDSDNFDIEVSSTITINAATTGINALDTGTFAASKLYYVFVVYDSSSKNSVGAIISLNRTAPVMPTGYDKRRLIGVFLVDSSTHFIVLNQSGNDKKRLYSIDEPISILSGGTSATFADVSLDQLVPAVENTRVWLIADFTPNAANDAAYLKAGGSSATNGKVIYGNVAAKKSSAEVNLSAKLVSSVPKITYKVTASGSLNLLLGSFEVYL